MKDKKLDNYKQELNDEHLNDVDEPERYGVISRIIGVFTEPDHAFSFIAKKPEIWGPVILTLFVGVVYTFLTLNTMVPLTEKLTAELLANMDVPQEMIDKQVDSIEKTAPFGAINILIMYLLTWAIAALLIWMGAMFMGQGGSYKTSIAILAYATMPSILFKTGIISTVLLMTRSWQEISDYMITNMKFLSLYGLIGNTDMNVNLQVLLSQIDPFLIWGVYLMAIGFKHVNGSKRSLSWNMAIIATIIWLAVNNPIPAATMKMFVNGG